MITIKSIRSTSTLVCAGEYAYDAEAKIVIKSNDECREGFVHVSWAMGETYYIFSYASEYDYMTGATNEEPDCDHIEEFTSLEDAQNSDYFEIYRMLDKVLYDMFHGPSRCVTSEAKMDTLETEADANDFMYHFAAIQSFKYENIPYKATFCLGSSGEDLISLEKDGVLVERFDDLELASSSDWFILYCKLKKELLSVICKYEEEHKNLGENFNNITSFFKEG